ncbi:MAG: DEAD/DEAH box helicase [Candidatus Eisenbacteria sp.]|nr:DEAD/DEAH box helicase [Candidatus Eisenbacteria bacterium]
MTCRTYNVGDRVFHQVFGEGLVVDARARDFFDILEIAFSDGVRKVTSIHPQLRPASDEELAQQGGFSSASGASTGPSGAAGLGKTRARRTARKSLGLLDPASFRFKHSAIPRLDQASLEPFLRGKGPERSDPRSFFLHLDALKIARQRGFERLLALNHTRDVQRLEHQIRACLRVLREMKGRALLADEVGLGKTIEAGLILKEYLLRALVRNILILTPASLVTQWREELRHKFDLPVHTYARGDAWDEHPILIASIDTAKSLRNRRAITAAGFDMLVVDEAHRLRNHLTQAWKFIDSLSLKYLLLLTATPVQNDLRELYNLITLLRPGVLGTHLSFRRKFVARGDKRLPKNTHKLSQLLADVMIRTTRSNTSIRFPRRDVRTITLDLGAQERLFYEEVSDFVRRMATMDERQRGSLPWPLLLVVLQKEIGSSPAAAIGTLKRAAAGRLRGMRTELERLLALGLRVERHVKLEALMEIALQRAKQGDKVLVFSQFRCTVEFLGEALRRCGLRVGLFHGSLTAAHKDAVVNAFRDDLEILISTEAGGEGRNLQFCRTVVNYDLPWNPMRVEQRIGRVHRIGQTRDVHIFNLSARGTLESYVLQVLQEKISMFNLVIGEMDQILGRLDWDENFEARVFRLWAQHSHGRDLEKAFTGLGNEMQVARERYEHVKRYDQEIFEGADGR